MIGYKISSSVCRECSLNLIAGFRPELYLLWKQSGADLTLKKCLAETKASIQNHFFFHLDLLWITGLSSRHQDVHCRKGRCFYLITRFLFGFLISMQKSTVLNPVTPLCLRVKGSSCCSQSAVMTLTHIRLLEAGGASARFRWMTQWLRSRKSVLCFLYTRLAAGKHRLQIWKSDSLQKRAVSLQRALQTER